MQWLYKTLQFFFSLLSGEYGADINPWQQKQSVLHIQYIEGNVQNVSLPRRAAALWEPPKSLPSLF